ncbi:hypothetical protein J5I95_13695 [Candidatus Poribacteria bacterium]|nr:hypothetical protein [Candidatus Poribacteria bacterium]
MNPAKNDLKAALQKEGQPPGSDTPKSVDPAPVEPSSRRPSRQGKKLISGHFDKDVHHQLKVICLETDSTIQKLLAESLNLLFEKHKKEPIA